MATVLHELVAKLNAARLRRETLHGREYLVVPTTILRPDSVMNGSKGPLFYPRSEVAKNPGTWNGIPLLLNHPSEGQTGRDPRVLANYGLGYLFGDRVTNSGARVADAWFDVELVRKHDADLPPARRMLPRLESGKPIDVSTGLYTDDRPVKNGVTLKTNRGKRFTQDSGLVATNYRPDHLAVLPLVRGACSSDAEVPCGTHVVGNKKRPSSGLDMSADKACKIVKDGSVQGHPLTAAQRGMFGALCGTKNEATATREEYRVAKAWNRDWPQAKRDALDSRDFAGPGQSFPISTQADVDAASHLVGKAADPEGVKARIKAIAKRKGLSVPEAWNMKRNANPKGINQYTKGGGAGAGADPFGPHASASRAVAATDAAHAVTQASGWGTGKAADFSARAKKAAGKGDFLKAARLHKRASENLRTFPGAAAESQAHHAAAQAHFHAARMNTNSEGDDMALTTKRRAKLVSGLVANCECWSGKEKVLNEMDDETLVAVHSQAVQVENQREALDAVREELGIDDPDLVFNAEYVKSPDMKKKMKAACSEPDPDDNTPTAKTNQRRDNDEEDEMDGSAIQRAIEEQVAKAVSEHPVVRNAERVVARERADLRARLTVTANLRTTPAAKKTLILNKLKDKDLSNEALEELLTLVGEPARNARHPVSEPEFEDDLPDFLGAGGGASEVVTGNAEDVDDEKVEKFASDDGMNPTTNWDNRISEIMNGQRKLGAKS